LNFAETPIAGAFLITPERHVDDRGFFARTFCEDEYRAHGLEPHVAQSSISFNAKAATLRGMHYQIAPHEEAKTVRCTMGAIHDVIVDLRRESPTYRTVFAATLSADNRAMLYIPPGCAHGFITLEDASEVFYQMNAAFAPGAARGFRWDDAAFAIEWPLVPAVISDRDAAWPAWSEAS
jgi:dTDP-4-dehydrorhamnose 3,5-epimerase